jgi:hypothetical protein
MTDTSPEEAALRVMAAGWSLGGTCEDDQRIAADAVAAWCEAEAEAIGGWKSGGEIIQWDTALVATWLRKRAAALRGWPLRNETTNQGD